MEKLILYSYSRCSTCRKASNWLDQKGFEYKSIDLIKEPPTVKFLDLALKQYSSDISKVFNKRGKSFKLMDVDIFTLTKEEIIKLLSNDGKLVKRPFLVYGKRIILGFDEREYTINFS